MALKMQGVETSATHLPLLGGKFLANIGIEIFFEVLSTRYQESLNKEV